jgi:hypothetical protein
MENLAVRRVELAAVVGVEIGDAERVCCLGGVSQGEGCLRVRA